MKIPIILFVMAFAASCASSKVLRQPAATWEEHFDQRDHFDTTRWSKIPRGRSDWHRNMSDYDGCYAMRDGKLILKGIRNENLVDDTARYLTGGVYTKDKVTFGFGRLEIRAKLNGATGAWPAFWLLGQGRKYPGGGEIDIMERLSHDDYVYQTVHSSYTIDLHIKDNPKQSATAKINPAAFNTYAVEKHRDSVVFFVNGQRNFAYPRIETDKKEQFPFSDGPHYLLLDMQLGGSWVGAVDPSQLPVEMEIDWVKFYEFK
ncbi:glycoside hydrolase family 16 protein [Niabella insulamsoli]|uniref:glycoside hydrolase family 16 protein n=1 Tax=Niabella insulamsoli TaxID=3144874 RepID=UPI0031FC7EA4